MRYAQLMTDTASLAEQARLTRTTSAGWMIQRLAGHLNRQMTKALAAHDLRLDQFVILMALTETSGTTQSALAQRVGMQNYTVTRTVDALAKRGLVERLPDPQSRRAWNLVLTPAGEALMPELFALVDAINATFLAEFPAPAKARFLRLLTRLVQGSDAEISADSP